MTKYIKIISLVFSLVFFSQYSSAQLIRYKNFSLKDGLPHKTVFRVIQQNETGIIWLGTEYGLCRYDGYEFINFSFQDSVSLNAILSVIELNNDSLLVSFYREGVFIFCNGKLTPIKCNSGVCDKVVQLVKDNTNTIYGYEKGGNLYIYKNAELKQIKVPRPRVFPRNIGFSPTTGLLIGTTKGLFTYKKGHFSKYPSEKLHNRRIDFIRTNNDNSVWIASNNKIFKLEGRKVTVEWDNIDSCSHSLIHIDNRGYIWRASPEQGLLVKIGKGVINLNSLLNIKNEIINCIEEDREGSIWVGTQHHGVFCINVPEHTKTFNIDGNKNKLPYSSAVLALKETYWIASQGRLFKIQNNDTVPIKYTFFNNSSSIYNLFQDRNNRILAATSKGIFVYDTKKNKYFVINNEYSGATDFCYTKQNDLLISSFKGLYTLKDNSLSPYNIDGIEDRINTIITDTKGDLWLGGEKILYKTKRNKTVSIKKNIKVFDLLLDNEDNVWAATNKGILKYNKQGKETSYTVKDGLLHTLCNALEIDKKGNIWVATLKGLNYYEKNKNRFFAFDIHPFVEMDEILSLSIQGDNILLGTVDNAYEIKLEIPISNPSIVISKMVVGDSVLYSPNYIELPYKNNSLSIYYSSVAVAHSQQLRYETKLTPIDTGWNTTTLRSINYKNLPPGKYTFSVRAKNHSNGKVSHIESFKFTVKTPFWQKWWFIVSIIICAFLTARFIHRKRLKRIRERDMKKSEMEKQLLYLKMQAMNALMNPHFISNVLQSIIGYLEQLKPGEAVNDKYITYFSELIRLNLINSDKSYITLKDELRRIELYILLEKFRFKNKFEYKITTAPSIDKANIEIPNMIIQPFVENAINHGLLPAKGEGKLDIIIKSINDDAIEIIITDNGIGVNASKNMEGKKNHRSMGIQLVKERMKAANQPHPIIVEDIDTSEYGKSGTKVSITLEV